MSDVILNKKILAVSNLLEQIELLNDLIKMHQSRGQDGTFMVSQYENRKLVFVQDLQAVLQNFQLKIQLEHQAA